MQRPSVEYYTFASIDGRSTTIRTAAMGRDAVMVIRQGSRITIAPIPVEQLGLRLAAALPAVPAAPVHSMSCDDADLREVMKDKAAPQSKSVQDAKRMKRALESDRTNTGQVYAAIRDGVGRGNPAKRRFRPGSTPSEVGCFSASTRVVGSIWSARAPLRSPTSLQTSRRNSIGSARGCRYRYGLPDPHPGLGGDEPAEIVDDDLRFSQDGRYRRSAPVRAKPASAPTKRDKIIRAGPTATAMFPQLGKRSAG